MGETNLAKKVASKTGRSSLGSSVTLIVMNPPCIKSDVIAHIENRDPIDYAEYISEYELMDEDPFRGDMALIVPIYLNGLNESFIGKTKNDLAKAIDIGTVRVVLPSITKTETISDDLFFDINAWTNERARRISKMLSTTDNTLITAA